MVDWMVFFTGWFPLVAACNAATMVESCLNTGVQFDLLLF